MRFASRPVTRPWSTASPSTSSIRSRDSSTMSIGLIRFLRSASLNSATVFASTPAPRAPRGRLPLDDVELDFEPDFDDPPLPPPLRLCAITRPPLAR